MRIEAVRQVFTSLPIKPQMLAHLRKTARLFSTHYSTMIEGNRLTQDQVAKVIEKDQHFPGRERDQSEVKGYYAALDELERIAKRDSPITETIIQKLHALVVGGGKTRVKPTPYCDGQNVIRDSRSQGIVYMPPEAKDVPKLMRQLVAWICRKDDLPIPARAAIAHYQFATIHPYYDGNGRTARLLTTLILHLNGYDLKGIYTLKEQRKGRKDQSKFLRTLDAKQRKTLELFQDTREILSRDVATLFGYAPRTASLLCHKWVEAGFFEIASEPRKTRRYKLAKRYEDMIAAEDSSQ